MKREEGREGGKEKGQIMQTARKAEESQGRGDRRGGAEQAGQTRRVKRSRAGPDG